MFFGNIFFLTLLVGNTSAIVAVETRQRMQIQGVDVGAMVQAGMRANEVRRILGEPSVHWVHGPGAGIMAYPQHGLQVNLLFDQVTSVTPQNVEAQQRKTSSNQQLNFRRR